MKKKVKLRKDRIIIVFAVLIALIVGISGIIRDIKLKNSMEYKLGEVGYSEKEIKIIKENTNDKELEKILKQKYNNNIPKLLPQKYFQFEKLDRYLAYQKENRNVKMADVVSIVNSNADYEFYTNTEKTDTKKDYTMMVNKHYQLEKDFKPDDIVDCSLMYAYEENSLREEAYNAFKQLFKAAKKEGHVIIINSSYRDYDWQNRLYKSYKAESGQEYADSIAARPGFSEHQTGLSIDVATYNTPLAKFEDTEEFKWMSKNAHKYGFILRYPKGKEKITGYDYEPWHYRYVGVDVAKDIYEKNITFDEYYELYLK